MRADLEPEPVTEGICWLCMQEGKDPVEQPLYKTPLSAPECEGHARASWRSYLWLGGSE